jgi:hypothetical protein
LKVSKKDFKFTSENPEDEIVFAELGKLYEVFADLTIDVGNKNEKTISEKIAKSLDNTY